MAEDDHGHHNGIEVRYRHGIGETGAVEGALGGDLRWPSRAWSREKHVRTRASLGLWVTPPFGVLAGGAVGAGEGTVSGGIQLGSWPGLVAGLGYLLLLLGLAY